MRRWKSVAVLIRSSKPPQGGALAGGFCVVLDLAKPPQGGAAAGGLAGVADLDFEAVFDVIFAVFATRQLRYIEANALVCFYVCF